MGLTADLVRQTQTTYRRNSNEFIMLDRIVEHRPEMLLRRLYDLVMRLGSYITCWDDNEDTPLRAHRPFISPRTGNEPPWVRGRVRHLWEPAVTSEHGV